jgi:capsular polysaccharide biosynthesis protein
VTIPSNSPVETSEYIAAARRRLPVLLGVPALAVLLVLLTVAMSPTRYRGTVTVAGTAFLGEGSSFSGSGAEKAFTDTFVAIAQSDGLADRVAQATGVARDDVREGLTAAPQRTTPVITVAYRTERKADAVKVASAAAQETLRSVLRLDVSQNVVTEAEAALAKAAADIDAFTARTGISLADADESVRIEQIADLEQQAIQSTARRDGSAAALRAAVDAKRKQLQEQRPALREFASLDAAETAARERLTDARKQLDVANGLLAASRSNAVVSAGDVRAVRRVDDAVRKGTAALGAGLVLGGVLVALLELASRRAAAIPLPRRRNRQAPERRAVARRA